MCSPPNIAIIFHSIGNQRFMRGRRRSFPFDHGRLGRQGQCSARAVAKLRAHVLAGSRPHCDDTPVPVLEPGKGKTKTGGRRTYIRDGRRWGDETPPAVSYFYGPARKGEHPKAHVADFSGILHADGYAGFHDLMKQPTRQTRRYPGRSAGRMSAASSSI
jgi:hypothetical protein